MKVYLGVGSNIDAARNIERSQQALTEYFTDVRFSRVFESEAVGFEGENFLNQVVEITTERTLEQLIDQLKQLEDKLGRIRGGAKFSSRHIDIDILLYGEMVCQQPIVLPREEIRHNAYVLWPLSELAPTLKEPGGQLTYSSLWERFDKKAQKLTPLN